MKVDNNSQRQKLTDVAKSKAILEVAQTFGMELQEEGKEFSGKWQGHDLNLTDRPTNFTGMVKVSVRSY